MVWDQSLTRDALKIPKFSKSTPFPPHTHLLLLFFIGFPNTWTRLPKLKNSKVDKVTIVLGLGTPGSLLNRDI